VLVLQDSFCREANYEEKITDNVNDEDLRKREQMKIKSEKLIRSKSISRSINHPLVQLSVHLLSSGYPSTRILGLRQLEEQLNSPGIASSCSTDKLFTFSHQFLTFCQLVIGFCS